ncbi:MAG: TetR/AcrR family transcriptional regulator, partial [Spirochaetales bacterium]|nr:TetR/AcrR family transcriptional regulator [Spirochaetales bacterium]
MEKLSKRQLKGIETKIRITRTALELFKSRGFNDVTVRDICSSASISIGSFYHHFESKEEIINTAHKQLDKLWEERIANFKYQKNVKENILYLFEEAGMVMQELGWEMTAHSYVHLLTSLKKYATQTDRPIYVHLRSVIAVGILEDYFKPETDVETLTNLLVRSARGVLFDWCLNDGEYSLPQKLRSDLSIILDDRKSTR